MTREIEINKDNWSGESTTVTINDESGEFTISSMEGYTFRLEVEEDTPYTEIEMESYRVHGSEWDDALASVWRMKLGGRWDPSWTAMESDVSWDVAMTREHADKFAAAAQLLCNLI